MHKLVSAVLAVVVVGLVAPDASAQDRKMKCTKVIDAQSLVSQVTNAGGVNASSGWINTAFARFFSFQSKCTSSAGTAEYNVEWYAAAEKDSSKLLEPTANSFGDMFSSTNTGETWTPLQSFFPPGGEFGKLVLYGAGDNPYDTTCDAMLCKGD